MDGVIEVRRVWRCTLIAATMRAPFIDQYRVPPEGEDVSLPNDDKKNCTSMIMSSGVTIDQVYQEIKKIREDMVKREDLEALVDTVEILSNPATMQAIKKSDQDIRQGRVKTITTVDDLLNECD